LLEVIERLSEATPIDAANVDLRNYRGLVAPWVDWAHVVTRGRVVACALSPLALEPEGTP
jgi:uncharacterized membrane protein